VATTRVVVSFDAVTITGDWHGGQALGTFTMGGTLGDAGTVRIAGDRSAHRRCCNVNITLLFSVERYEHVIEAYIRGLERRLATGQPLDSLASVASFFVSRVDAKADALLPADSDLRGRVAVANAQRAYARYHRRFADDRWRTLADAARTASDRCGRAPGPRTRPTPTCSTSSS
jgi:Transaldolase/Fructose-6-phosphate aldolase